MPDLVLVFLHLEDDDGIELLTDLRRLWPESVSVLVVGYVDMNTAVRAVNKARINHVLQAPPEPEAISRIASHLAIQRAATNHHQNLLVRLEEQRVRLNSTREELEQRAYENMFEMLEGFLSMLQLRSPSWDWHARRVSLYSLGIGRVMGFGEDELTDIARGALLHDIGTISLPDNLLFKEGPLTPNEEALMRAHPLLGYQFLEAFEFLAGARDVVLQHHERHDGEGYPLGLSGDGICVGARVFAVADTLESMTSQRPYREAYDFEEAYEAIIEGSGSAYDPEVVEAFRIIPKESWRAAVEVGQACEHGHTLSREVRQLWSESVFVEGFKDGNLDEPWARISLRNAECRADPQD